MSIREGARTHLLKLSSLGRGRQRTVRDEGTDMNRPQRPRRLLWALAASLALVATSVAPVGAKSDNSGFWTGTPAMLEGTQSNVTVKPLLTVGDTVGGYTFEAIPDGISVRPRGQGRVDLYVNHETSKVPFPYVTAGPTALNSENDFDNAQVSQLILNQHSAGVLNGSFAIARRASR